MAKLGSVDIDVVFSDEPKRKATITEHPVEEGSAISDHIRTDPISVSIKGIVTGHNAFTKLKKIEAYWKSGTVLNYIHRTAFKNMVIESFDTAHTVQVGNGFEFTISMREMRIAEASAVKYMAVPARVKIKPVVKKGVQQKQKPKQIKETKKKAKKKSSSKKSKTTKKNQPSTTKTNTTKSGKSSLTKSGLSPAQLAAQNGNRVRR